MIKFVRHIRQCIIMENSKSTRYLKYAIGEIILVVIGILIALQINNWNENRKKKNEIQRSLIALKEDLHKDITHINEQLPEVQYQYTLNESLRQRLATKGANTDTLLKITRTEFNPNWTEPIIYNTNSYNSLLESGLMEELEDSLKNEIKDFYNQKYFKLNLVTSVTQDYRVKLRDYVDHYTFGSTALHDQGPFIDSLVWSNVNFKHLAAAFQGLSNFKRILFNLTRDEMEFSQKNSELLINQINEFLEKT